MMFRHAAVRLALAVVAVTVVVAGVVALVGGDDRTFVPSSAVAQAAATTQRVPGVSVDMRGAVTIGTLGPTIHIHLAGVQNTRERSVRTTGEYTDMPDAAPGVGSDGRAPIEIIAALPHVYMKTPVLGDLPEGKSWVGYNIVELSKQMGTGDPTRFGQGDPMAMVRLLRAAGDRVEKVGGERVRGVATTHYRGKVELRRMPDTLPAAQRPEARRSIERLIDLAGIESYPLDVWIDDRHLLRRMRLKMRMKMPNVDKTMTMDMTTEYFGFGPKPKAKAPPAGDVYDVTDQAAAAVNQQQPTP